jgi:regulatory protein
MSEPRVARLDVPAPDDEPATVLDLGEVGHGPAEAAAVAALGAVPGAASAGTVADLDAVGRAAEAGGSGPEAAPAGTDSDPPDRHAAGPGAGPVDLDAMGDATPVPARLARLDGRLPRGVRRGAGRDGIEPVAGSGRGGSAAGAPVRGVAADGGPVDSVPVDSVPADSVPADGAAADAPPTARTERRRRGGAAVPTAAEETAGEAGERDARPGRSRRPPGPRQIDPDADPVAAAREICLRLLTDRARTRTELAQALARRGVPAAAADTVLERFDEVGLIDDAAFAGQWVRSRHRHRGLARRAIAQELRRKGVDDEVAGEALAEVDGESEARRARELVDRKLRTLPAGTPEQRATAARKLVGMLARKGYGAGVAYGVVKEALAEHGADHEELGADGPDLD